MSQFDDGDLPPELGDIADVLRAHRYEASELELDKLKTRTMKRTHGRLAAKGGGMRIRALVTAGILFAAIGSGSAAALSIGGGFRIPLFNLGRPAAVQHPAASAAVSMYGGGLTTVEIRCIPIAVTLGGSTLCTTRVTGLFPQSRPTGVVTLTSTSGGTFNPAFCTLVGDVGNSATCAITYTPTATGTVSAHYSGDATFAPNDSTVGARVTVR